MQCIYTPIHMQTVRSSTRSGGGGGSYWSREVQSAAGSVQDGGDQCWMYYHRWCGHCCSTTRETQVHMYMITELRFCQHTAEALTLTRKMSYISIHSIVFAVTCLWVFACACHY